MRRTWTDISSLHALYEAGTLLPSEVTKYYLDRIARLNPLLNIYLTITGESALEVAKTQDKMLQENNNVLKGQPLFGVPVAFKDIYMTKDIRTTAGSMVLEDYIASYDATVVKKYKEAGAILLGKLNCDAWAHGSSGENSDFGATKNPWNIEYVPGGSSSGSGAAIAADLCMVAGGSDTGGSVRCPASFCGVVGLKPTYGRVSRYGVISMASSLDSIGHLTQYITDSARVLSVTAGKDQYDATTSTQSVPNYLDSLSHEELSLSGLRIGIPKEYKATDPEVEKLFQSVKTKLTELGANLIDVSLPHTDLALACYYIIQPAEVSSNLARYDGIRFGKSRSSFGIEAKRRIMLGTYTLSSGYYDAYYKTALKVRSLVTEDFVKAFENVDLLVGPVMPHLPFKIGEKVSDPLALYLEDVLTVPINLSGLPAIAVPCGISSSKLPVGFQIIGPHFSEDKIFNTAQTYQLATNWHNEKPQI